MNEGTFSRVWIRPREEPEASTQCDRDHDRTEPEVRGVPTVGRQQHERHAGGAHDALDREVDGTHQHHQGGADADDQRDCRLIEDRADVQQGQECPGIEHREHHDQHDQRAKLTQPLVLEPAAARGFPGLALGWSQHLIRHGSLRIFNHCNGCHCWCRRRRRGQLNCLVPDDCVAGLVYVLVIRMRRGSGAGIVAEPRRAQNRDLISLATARGRRRPAEPDRCPTGLSRSRCRSSRGCPRRTWCSRLAWTA